MALGRLLYTSAGFNTSQMYMLLVVVLILSQNADFSRTVHQTVVPAVPWYKERLLKDISPGQYLQLPNLLAISMSNS